MSDQIEEAVSIPLKPFRVYDVVQPGDLPGELLGGANSMGDAVVIACAVWSTAQEKGSKSGWVVAVWDESVTPAAVVAFVGRYGTGQYPTG